MTRDEAIREACSIMALVYHSIGDYSRPSDGFCGMCPASHRDWNYQNTGEVFAYVRRAILATLKADGYKTAIGFDPDTGKELQR